MVPNAEGSDLAQPPMQTTLFCLQTVFGMEILLHQVCKFMSDRGLTLSPSKCRSLSIVAAGKVWKTAFLPVALYAGRHQDPCRNTQRRLDLPRLLIGFLQRGTFVIHWLPEAGPQGCLMRSTKSPAEVGHHMGGCATRCLLHIVCIAVDRDCWHPSTARSRWLLDGSFAYHINTPWGVLCWVMLGVWLCCALSSRSPIRH